MSEDYFIRELHKNVNTRENFCRSFLRHAISSKVNIDKVLAGLIRFMEVLFRNELTPSDIIATLEHYTWQFVYKVFFMHSLNFYSMLAVL